MRMNGDTVLFFQSNSWNHDNLKQNGVNEVAHRIGWRVQLIASADVRGASLRNLLEFWNPLGCVIDCGNREIIPPPLDFGKTPVVYLDCRKGLFGKTANYVSHDAIATVRLCARELLSRGLVHFAYVGHYGHQNWSEDRKNAFSEIISAHGFRLRIFAPDLPTGELEFRKGLETFLSKLPRPCGLLAVNDEIGEMTTVAANRLQLRMPDDLAVISIDNNPRVCESLTPTLSSVEVDFHRAGELAIELLHRLVSRKTRANLSATFGPVRVIHRSSSSNLADCAAAVMSEHIRKNAFSPLRASEVTGLAKGSRRNAEKRFRKATGHSILEEIHAVRLSKAKELLLKSNYQIPEIANMCGYASESYFRKLFRTSTGLSPLKFRQGNPLHS